MENVSFHTGEQVLKETGVEPRLLLRDFSQCKCPVSLVLQQIVSCQKFSQIFQVSKAGCGWQFARLQSFSISEAELNCCLLHPRDYGVSCRDQGSEAHPPTVKKIVTLLQQKAEQKLLSSSKLAAEITSSIATTASAKKPTFL